MRQQGFLYEKLMEVGQVIRYKIGNLYYYKESKFEGFTLVISRAAAGVRL